MSSAVIIVEEHGSIKIALDSKQLNEATVKRKEQMANLTELNSRIERKTSEGVQGENGSRSLFLFQPSPCVSRVPTEKS